MIVDKSCLKSIDQPATFLVHFNCKTFYKGGENKLINIVEIIQKSFLNLAKVKKISRSIRQQTEFSLVPNQSKNGKYNQIQVY